MIKKLKEQKLVYFVLCIAILLILFFWVKSNTSLAKIQANNTQIEDGEELIYYITVSYDYNNYYSSNAVVKVEDKLLDGLTFVRFANTTEDSLKPIGGPGNVIGGLDGLHYDENTRTISFELENIYESSFIKVGVVVRANSSFNREDIYNTAYASDGYQYIKSNSLHNYIGDENVETYKVQYVLNGVPEGIQIDAPNDAMYALGQNVIVEKDVNIDNYTFSGWTTNDVTVDNGSFTMPNKTVTFTGTVTKEEEPKYRVRYQINGKIPDDAYIPYNYDCYEGESVYLPTYSGNYFYEGYYYSFSGWEYPADLVFVDETDFIMPNKDVTVVGSFIKNKAQIHYYFGGNTWPKDESVYQMEEYYYPGENVHLKTYENTTCVDLDDNEFTCKFIGWNRDTDFIMPSQVVEVTGFWKKLSGTFIPEIESSITNEKESYKKGDTVLFKVLITNNEDYDLYDVYVKSELNGNKFIDRNTYNTLVSSSTRGNENDYSIEDDYLIHIDHIPAKSSQEVFLVYNVEENVDEVLTSKVEIVGARGTDGFYLDDQEHISSIDFNISSSSNEQNTNNETNTTSETNNTVIEKNETNTTIIPDNPSTPKTSDNAWIYIVSSIISLILIVVIFIIFKKKKKE